MLLLFFFTGSFFNGMVIEFGRKIKAPECEREGMESYSRALGLQPAVVVLTASVIAAQACLTLALPHLSSLAALVFAVFDCFAFAIFHRFMTKPNLANQKKLDAIWLASSSFISNDFTNFMDTKMIFTIDQLLKLSASSLILLLVARVATCELVRHGLPVPPFFIVSAKALELAYFKHWDVELAEGYKK
jgi:uncharacterized membrane protein YphA (DoxX/SURF4 family)